jgi:glycosyltransferase involved in cell wall biosynthesis
LEINVRKILIITDDTVGSKMAGPAIRAIELGRVLSNYFDVTIAANLNDQNYIAPINRIDADQKCIYKLLKYVDIIIFQGATLKKFPEIKSAKAALIADMYCPIPFEYHISSLNENESDRIINSWNVSQMIYEQFFVADYFICASQRQIDLWVGALMVAGRINPIAIPDGSRVGVDEFFASVPFGLDENYPISVGTPLRDKFGIGKDEFLIVWGGGIYQWFDPITIIKAIAELEKTGVIVHLVFMGVKHPNPCISAHDQVSVALGTARNLEILNKLVHFNFDWIEYADRHKFIMDANVGVSSHLDNFETRYSFRTRMLDYMWCGLPIIATKGDEFSEIISRNKLGLIVDYEDVSGWVIALKKMMQDNSFFEACQKNVICQRSNFTWAETSKALVHVCNVIKPARDRSLTRKKLHILINKNLILGDSVLAKIKKNYKRGGIFLIIKKIIKKYL